jgi:hypothetical protein
MARLFARLGTTPALLAVSASIALLMSAADERRLGAAQATSATVEGRVRLPEGGIREPDAQYVGYIERIANPITELRPYDPRPECFVFLEGGPVGAGADAPPPKAVTWILNSGFASPILAVVAGTKVEIKNVSRGITHPLYVVDAPTLLSAEPLGPGGSREFVAKDAGKPLIVRSKDAPHVDARVVALPTRYFAVLKRDGSFSVPDVPYGKWTAKIWYRNGWLPVTRAVEVSSRTDKVELRLPDKLEVENKQ